MATMREEEEDDEYNNQEEKEGDLHRHLTLRTPVGHLLGQQVDDDDLSVTVTPTGNRLTGNRLKR